MFRSEQRHPFAASVRLRVRELARRPLVQVAFTLQALGLVVFELADALTRSQALGARQGVVATGLQFTAAPGGLVFGVLAAAVVGAEFTWATERALLARDPRRLRFAGLQLAIVAPLGAAWWAGQSAVAVGVGSLCQAGVGPAPPGELGGAAVARMLGGVLAAIVAYGLLGAACTLVFRGGPAGVFALVAYGVLGELALAPLWKPAVGWTLYTAALRLTGHGSIPVLRAAVLLGAAGACSLAAALGSYARRDVRS